MVKHIVHALYVRRVEVTEVESRKLSATVEHLKHIRDVRGVELRHVDGSQITEFAEPICSGGRRARLDLYFCYVGLIREPIRHSAGNTRLILTVMVIIRSVFVDRADIKRCIASFRFYAPIQRVRHGRARLGVRDGRIA